MPYQGGRRYPTSQILRRSVVHAPTCGLAARYQGYEPWRTVYQAGPTDRELPDRPRIRRLSRLTDRLGTPVGISFNDLFVAADECVSEPGSRATSRIAIPPARLWGIMPPSGAPPATSSCSEYRDDEVRTFIDSRIRGYRAEDTLWWSVHPARFDPGGFDPVIDGDPQDPMTGGASIPSTTA